MYFKPLGNRVLIEKKEVENTTKTGLIIPDSAKDKPSEGKVISVGKKAEEEGITTGDTVLFTQYGGTEVKIENKNYLIFSSDDILGILK